MLPPMSPGTHRCIHSRSQPAPSSAPWRWVRNSSSLLHLQLRLSCSLAVSCRPSLRSCPFEQFLRFRDFFVKPSAHVRLTWQLHHSLWRAFAVCSLPWATSSPVSAREPPPRSVVLLVTRYPSPAGACASQLLALVYLHPHATSWVTLILFGASSCSPSGTRSSICGAARSLQCACQSQCVPWCCFVAVTASASVSTSSLPSLFSCVRAALQWWRSWFLCEPLRPSLWPTICELGPVPSSIGL